MQAQNNAEALNEPEAQGDEHAPGVERLLMPSNFSSWGQDEGLLQESRRPIHHPPLLPLFHPANIDEDLLQPDAIADGLPPKLRFHKLQRLAVTTKKTSRTKISEAVKSYRFSKQLHRIKISDELWTALVGFAVNPEVMPPVGRNAPIPLPCFNTFRDETQFPIPLLADQRRPVANLWAWFLMHLTTPDPLVNSETSVQDEVYRQLLFPMNQIIEGRFGSFITVVQDEERRFSARFSRPVEEHRVDQITKAGVSDFVLYSDDILRSQTLAVEVKTSWSYDFDMIHGALSDMTLTDGVVEWEQDETPECSILKQIWSEMLEFGISFGIWTNGDEIVAAIVTTDNTVPENERLNELTFSRIQDINEGDFIYQGIAGLCFASIEHKNIEDEEGKQAFIDALCPPESRMLPEGFP